MLPALALLAPLSLLTPAARADEGMWLPEQLPDHADRLAELGLQLPVSQVADPMAAPLGAIVSLGFCSASFVSPQGLMLTNHHCVGGYLQVNSSAANNRARDGHLAADRAGELSAGPGARVTIVEQITDVTDQVVGRIGKGTPDRKRQAKVEQARKALVAACEAKPDRRCHVASYFGGAQYRLISAREIKDIRIVYAPPESVGSYGGEVDNWMWPRHSGDFAVLRAYVAPDGSSAEYSPDNVPYQPPHWLQVDPTGAQEGEMVWVAGFPGHTNRYALASQVAWTRDVYYPWAIGLADAALAILAEESAASPEAAARLASPIDMIANGRKNNQGMLDNFRTSGVVERMQAREGQLRAWVAGDPARQRQLGPALAELDTIVARDQATWQAQNVVGRLTRYSDLLWVATTAVRLAEERKKPDLQRDEGYQARDEDRIRARFERLERSLWLPSDRRLLQLMLEQAQALPADQRVASLDAWLAEQGGVGPALDRLFAAPALADTAQRLALLDQDAAALAASADPWLGLARAIEQWAAPQRLRDKERAGAWLRLAPLWMQAVQGARPGSVYPDANGSLRVTFGRVEGYSPRDGVWHLPHTTVAGMAAKAGDSPFDAPERLLQAAPRAPRSRWADPALGDVPVDFLATLDTTGGNSGSATLNAQGQLVGLIFDGNYEAMSADWLFDDALTRSIHVDVRYLLWTLEEVEQAGWLVEELGQAPR
ncbi:S46 family peptidase [Myxococcota bacterium]|nr:S46 family peptidase [Myxococcota bacterium]